MNGWMIHTYRITHLTDPYIVNEDLELGHKNCMKKIRSHANEKDWIIAQLGKTFYKYKNRKRIRPFGKSNHYDLKNKKYLFYAMKVTGKKSANGYPILCSKKGEYYCFFKNPIPIPSKFYEILTRGRAPNKKPYKEAKEFLAWIKKQRLETGTEQHNEQFKGCTTCKRRT